MIEIALCLAEIAISIAFDCGQNSRFSIAMWESCHHYCHARIWRHWLAFVIRLLGQTYSHLDYLLNSHLHTGETLKASKQASYEPWSDLKHPRTLGKHVMRRESREVTW